MKKLMISLLALVSTAAMACPTIEGSFSCVYDPNEPAEQMQVATSTDANGNTVYSINGNMHITMDGVAVQLPDDQNQSNRFLTGTCDATAGIITYTTDLIERGQNVGNGVAITRIYLDAASNLIQDTNSDFLYHGQKYQNHQVVKCDRL